MGRKNQSKGHTKKESSILTTKKRKEITQLTDKLLKVSTAYLPLNTEEAISNQKVIDEVVQAIRAVESNVHVLPTDRKNPDVLNAFTEWMRDGGSKFDSVSIAEFPGYDFGLKAESDIPQGTLMVAVPRKLMMTPESAKMSVLGPLIAKDALLQNMPNVLLAIHLLVEKFSPDSFWKPYIDVLPSSYNTVMYFKFEELLELQSSPTLRSSLKQLKNVARQYAYFHRVFSTSDDPASKLLRNNFTYDLYCWAVSTIMTRLNSLPSEDGKEMITGLIPLWDFCNHVNGDISTDYNPVLQRSECLALRDFKKNEQLFIFYGVRLNSDLFVHNGFVYEDNIHDGYWLRLGISKSDPLYDKRTALLNRAETPVREEFLISVGPEPFDGQLLSFVRIFTMKEEQLQHWLNAENVRDLQRLEFAFDKETEKRAWKFLTTRIRLLLSTYKTTLAEDVELLKDKNLSDNRLLAIRMRMTEKKILLRATDYAESQIN